VKRTVEGLFELLERVRWDTERSMRHHELTPVLDVSGLQVWFPHDPRSGAGDSPLRAVENVSFTLYSGRTLGLIGESGCGKTLTAQALLQLIPAPGRMRALHIALHGDGDRDVVDVASLDPRGTAIRRVRGGQIAMVFQDAAGSLSPVRTIGAQLREAIRLHRPLGRREADRVSVELLERVGLSDPRQRLREYAYQLSGGMSQRVAIALALCGEPRVLIADEPTTALDPELQRQVVKLIGQLQSVFGMAVLYITHDLGLVEEACDEVAVMYLGRIVEQAPVQTLLTRPLHPYTKRLLESVPVLGRRRGRLPTVPGAVPRLLDIPSGCSFAPRCEDVTQTCRGAVPALVEVAPGHRVRCYLHSSQREPGTEG
jgi:peptide/nickel transport system ATP-binding protein